MSYISSQYNYATPLSSVATLFDEQYNIPTKRYFSLFDNVLDGSCYPIDGDVGLWGSSLSDANGNLDSMLILTLRENMTVNAFRLVGDPSGYPTMFDVKMYNGSTLIYTFMETNNTKANYVHYLPKMLTVTRCVVAILALSAPGVPVRLYNVYNPGYVKRLDTVRVNTRDVSDASMLFDISRSDMLAIHGTSSMLSMHSAIAAADNIRLLPEETYNLSVLPFLRDTVPVKLHEEAEQHVTIEDTKDTLKIRQIALSSILKTLGISTDRLLLNVGRAASSITNYIDAVKDVCPIDITTTTLTGLTNVHSVMKQPTRHIYGKVYITYTDPMLASDNSIESSASAYNSNIDQVLDGNSVVDNLFFTLYDNDLSGRYVVSDANSQIGWVSAQLSNELGEFEEAPYIRINLSERPLTSTQITFDTSHGSVAKDFTVAYTQKDGNVVTRSVVDNENATVVINETVNSVTSITITVTRVAKAFCPVAILDIPVLSTYTYVGYRDKSDLISIDLLEELTYDDTIEALGGISANEVSVALDNSDGAFYFNNKNSPVAASLKRNRKIEPWLGVEITSGEIEWYALGTFWSYRWDVPVEGLVAKVVGFDTIGLLDKTDFIYHHTLVGKSIGYLIEYVLTDAKRQLGFLTWKIDPALYDIVIPYAWFEASSHTTALRKIGACYPMHIYCDREGAICAAPQKLKMDFYYDTWSDSTNVISKNYSSLYTTLPNIVSVDIKNPKIINDELLAEDEIQFDVSYISSRTLNFGLPYVSDINVEVTCDSTVNYTYEVFSWGIALNFTGTGNVTHIVCTGTALDIGHTATLTDRNEESIRVNGAVRRHISADFIQTSALAGELINRLLSLSENDKYDVDVEYRGDVSLTINDPILLLDGIAPDNRYNIRRHELFWNGSLSGSAHLNT